MTEKRRARTGLAGYVRTGPPLRSFFAAVLLFPFWLSSELAQAMWAELAKVTAIVSLWAILLGVVGAMVFQQPTPPTATVTDLASPEPGATASSPPTPTPQVDGTPLARPLPLTETPPGGVVPGVVAVLGEYKGLAISDEPARFGYDRDLFADWFDADGDGCDTREEVLIAESLDPVTVGAGCALSGGRWYSAYDGVTTTQPGTFDIDHFVPLAEAWDSGAYAWSPSRRRDYANDLDYAGSLIAVTASSNRSKGDQDPGTWEPPLDSYDCTYARTWIKVKDRWDLTADAVEVEALRSMLKTC